jgi:calcineurin-like phosphoesterase family protein
MKVWLISDTHFNHAKLATYCERPDNFTELIARNWRNIVKPDDLVIHLGDVIIGDRRMAKPIMDGLPGHKVLVRGNHDRSHSNTWWMENGGFDFACDAMVFRNVWLTHEPSTNCPPGCKLNVHGHLHTTAQYATLLKPWHKLFVLEFLDYMPVDFEKFIRDRDQVPHTANGAKHPLFNQRS